MFRPVGLFGQAFNLQPSLAAYNALAFGLNASGFGCVVVNKPVAWLVRGCAIERSGLDY